MRAPNTNDWAMAMLDLSKPENEGAYNRERVRSYWEKYPTCMQKEVARDLGISIKTAAVHLAEVRRDSRRWR